MFLAIKNSLHFDCARFLSNCVKKICSHLRQKCRFFDDADDINVIADANVDVATTSDT